MKKVWKSARKKHQTGRDFHRRSYGNPLFDRGTVAGRRASHSRGNGSSGGRRIGLIVLMALLVGAGSWYAFWSPALRITDITVIGAAPDTETKLRDIIAQETTERLAFIFPRSTILFFSKEHVRDAASAVFFFDKLEIRKKLPHTIEVTIIEKTMSGALADEGRFYALDASGKLIRELSGDELAMIHDLPPTVGSVASQGLGAEAFTLQQGDTAGQAGSPAALVKSGPRQNANPFPVILAKKTEPGQEAIAPTTMALILEANARLPDVAASAVRWYTVQDNSETIDANMEGDWHALLTTAIPFDVQSERLAVVLREKIGDKKGELDYVDLRYNERIFFRYKEKPAAKP